MDPLLADIDLVQRVVAGDMAAAEELFVHRTQRDVEWLAWHYRYEDLPGALCLHLSEDDYRRLRTYRGLCPVKSWVRQVAARLCLQHVKDSARFEHHDNMGEILDHLGESAPFDDGGSDRAIVLNAIEALKAERERLILRMLVYEHKDLVEIANILGVTRSNADVIKHRAIANLRQILKEVGVNG